MALIRIARDRASSASWSTPSPTGATRGPTWGWRPWRRSRPRGRSWPRSAGATRPWTATSAGTAPGGPTTRSSTARAPRRGERPSRRCAASYDAGVTDEFVEPRGDRRRGVPTRVRDGDAVIFFNFRPDRARQLTEALAEPGFDGFDRGADAPCPVTTMTRYEAELRRSRWPSSRRTCARASPRRSETPGCRQFHAAETEKYAHVTFFFNGGREEPFPGEDRRARARRPEVATYDLQPEMSARRRRRRRGRAAIDAEVRPASSSTTPTPTWWATPASWRRPSGRRDRGRLPGRRPRGRRRGRRRCCA